MKEREEEEKEEQEEKEEECINQLFLVKGEEQVGLDISSG